MLSEDGGLGSPPATPPPAGGGASPSTRAAFSFCLSGVYYLNSLAMALSSNFDRSMLSYLVVLQTRTRMRMRRRRRRRRTRTRTTRTRRWRFSLDQDHLDHIDRRDAAIERSDDSDDSDDSDRHETLVLPFEPEHELEPEAEVA